MLNIRTVFLSVAVLFVFGLGIRLVTAGTEVVSDPSSDPVIALDHQDRYNKMNNVPIPSYRSPLDVCYDVPLREAASCHNASQAPISSYRSPLDECYDVGLRDAVACRNASQVPVP